MNHGTRAEWKASKVQEGMDLEYCTYDVTFGRDGKVPKVFKVCRAKD